MLTSVELKERLIQAGLCEPHKLRGCSHQNLKRIEAHIGHPLPKAYKKLMYAIGRKAGEFMSDLEVFYPHIITLTDRNRDLLLSDDGVELPKNTFVFADRYGEQMLFFHLTTDDDPPIYRWSEDQPKRFRKVFKSIWEFIEEELEAHEAMMRDDDDIEEDE